MFARLHQRLRETESLRPRHGCRGRRNVRTPEFHIVNININRFEVCWLCTCTCVICFKQGCTTPKRPVFSSTSRQRTWVAWHKMILPTRYIAPQSLSWKSWFTSYIYGTLNTVVGWGTMLQAGKTRFRVPAKSLDFSIDLNLQPHYGPEVDSAANRNEYQESSWG
jgi:hypothetical protein